MDSHRMPHSRAMPYAEKSGRIYRIGSLVKRQQQRYLEKLDGYQTSAFEELQTTLAFVIEGGGGETIILRIFKNEQPHAYQEQLRVHIWGATPRK